MAQPVNFNFLSRPQGGVQEQPKPQPQVPPSRIPELRDQLEYFRTRCDAAQSGYQGEGDYGRTPLPSPDCDAVRLLEREIQLEQERLDDFQLKGLAKPSPLSSKADGLRAPVEQRLGLDKLEFTDILALPVTIPAGVLTAVAGAGMVAVGFGLQLGDVVFSEIGNAIESPVPSETRITISDVANFASKVRFENAPPVVPEQSNAEIEAILLAAPVRPRTRGPVAPVYTDFTTITKE